LTLFVITFDVLLWRKNQYRFPFLLLHFGKCFQRRTIHESAQELENGSKASLALYIVILFRIAACDIRETSGKMNRED